VSTDSALSPTKGLGDTLRAAAAALSSAGSETPRLDAELLLAHVLGLSRTELYTSVDGPLRDDHVASFEAVLARRAAHEPLAYILGEWGFRRLTLTVDRRALVPRPETEIVVERCLALLAGLDRPRVLDVGVGSGAIALAIVDEHPGARVVGIDASDDALALAGENSDRAGLPVELRRHDLFTGLPRGPWELVVSNPPYVRPEELDTLMPDVRDWEPRQALVDAGETEAIARRARSTLAPGGVLVLEVAPDRAARVAELLGELGYDDVRVTRDLAGRDRVVEGARSA
jgi:release factor glutamine methyltransferase